MSKLNQKSLAIVIVDFPVIYCLCVFHLRSINLPINYQKCCSAAPIVTSLSSLFFKSNFIICQIKKKTKCLPGGTA